MYALSSAILPSAISLLLPMKTFPKDKRPIREVQGGGGGATGPGVVLFRSESVSEYRMMDC